MRKRRIHFYDIGSTFSIACKGKGVSGEMLNTVRTKKRKEVTCPKCLKAIS